jgi:hypothetical protein
MTAEQTGARPQGFEERGGEDAVGELEAAIEDARTVLVENLDRLHALQRFRDIAAEVARDRGHPVAIEDVIGSADGDEVLRAELEGLARRITGEEVGDGE